MGLNVTPEVIKVSKNLCKFCNFIFLDKIPRKFHKKEKCGVSFKFLEVSSVENTFKISIYYILKFSFFKKATKFETMFHLIWRLLRKCQIKWKMVSNCCGLFRMSELYKWSFVWVVKAMIIKKNSNLTFVTF